MPPASASLFSTLLRILILQDILRSGGTERQSIVLTKGLLANGLDAQLVTFRPGGALSELADGLPGGALQAIDRGWDWHAPGLTIKIRSERPHFVVAMGRMANCRLGWLAAGPARLIATYRTGKPLPWLYRQALRRSAAVITNSGESAQTLTQRYGVPLGKITVIYNGLVFPSIGGASCPQPARTPDRFGARPTTTVLLCVAMLRPEKRQSELVETLAALPPGTDWQLWLVGDGPARAEIERRAEELGVTERVRCFGFQPDPAPFYAAADIAVHASERESLSNFLIEAQAHGLPVVAYAAQGIAECVQEGETGWIIRRGDRAAFGAAVLNLISAAPQGRQKLRAAAARFARDRFDSGRQIDAYVGLLRRLQSGAS